jgi:hypothetical protein
VKPGVQNEFLTRASVAGVREKSVVVIEPQAFEWNENTEKRVWTVFEMKWNRSPMMSSEDTGACTM